MKQRIRGLVSFCLLAFAAAVLVGCASNSVKPMSDNLTIDAHKAVSVIVRNSDTCENKATDEELNELKSLIEKKIIDTGKLTCNDNGDLQMTATVENFRRVGGAARLLIGAFAGKAEVAMDVVVVDPKTGLAKHFKAVGQSGGATIASGGTGTAMENAAEQVANYVAGK